MFIPTDDIDAIQASLLRTLASAHRLRIIHLLGIGPCEVNELARELGLSQAATSQHLAAMRAVGLVEAVRDGRTVALPALRPGDPRGLRPRCAARSSGGSPGSATWPRRPASRPHPPFPPAR